jgi:hypothetical protein
VTVHAVRGTLARVTAGTGRVRVCARACVTAGTGRERGRVCPCLVSEGYSALGTLPRGCRGAAERLAGARPPSGCAGATWCMRAACAAAWEGWRAWGARVGWRSRGRVRACVRACVCVRVRVRAFVRGVADRTGAGGGGLVVQHPLGPARQVRPAPLAPPGAPPPTPHRLSGCARRAFLPQLCLEPPCRASVSLCPSVSPPPLAARTDALAARAFLCLGASARVSAYGTRPSVGVVAWAY